MVNKNKKTKKAPKVLKSSKIFSQKFIDETIGWIGITLILVAYGLNTLEIINVKSVSYLVMNLLGSLGVVYIALKKKDYQPSVLNAIWALIAIIGLARIFI